MSGHAFLDVDEMSGPQLHGERAYLRDVAEGRQPLPPWHTRADLSARWDVVTAEIARRDGHLIGVPAEGRAS